MTDNLPTTIPANGVDTYRMSTDAATICRQLVLATAMEIQGRKYVRAEGWQAIAVAHGCAASACDVQRVDGGFRATGQVRRMDTGAVIAEAEGFVGEDEPTWFGGEVERYGKKKVLPKRPDFAIRAMAQTRAISRACRSAFAHVVVQIDKNLGTTPAEEMQGVYDHEPSSVDGPGSSWGAGGKQSAVDEAERDGLRANAPTATDAVRTRARTRVDKEISVFRMVGQTRETLMEYWQANKAAFDAIYDRVPDEHERLVTAYSEALENAPKAAA